MNLPLGTVQSSPCASAVRLRDKLNEQAGFADGSARLDSTGRSNPGFACGVGPPAAIVGKTCRSAKLWAAGAARLDTIVSSDVQWLIEPGARSMLVSQLKVAPLILVAATILSGVALLASQTSAQQHQDEPRPSPQSPVAASQSPRTSLSYQAKSSGHSAPEELRVAAGRGTALLFALDPDAIGYWTRPMGIDNLSIAVAVSAAVALGGAAHLEA